MEYYQETKRTIFLKKKHPFYLKMLAVKLKQVVRKYISDYGMSEIICLAKVAEHRALFTHPYNSDLQQLEVDSTAFTLYYKYFTKD